jgi:hypothetical protein
LYYGNNTANRFNHTFTHHRDNAAVANFHPDTNICKVVSCVSEL